MIDYKRFPFQERYLMSRENGPHSLSAWFYNSRSGTVPWEWSTSTPIRTPVTRCWGRRSLTGPPSAGPLRRGVWTPTGSSRSVSGGRRIHWGTMTGPKSRYIMGDSYHQHGRSWETNPALEIKLVSLLLKLKLNDNVNEYMHIQWNTKRFIWFYLYMMFSDSLINAPCRPSVVAFFSLVISW